MVEAINADRATSEMTRRCSRIRSAATAFMTAAREACRELRCMVEAINADPSFEIAGDVLEILRHPPQHLVYVTLVHQPRHPTGMRGLFAVVTRRMHTPSTGVSSIQSCPGATGRLAPDHRRRSDGCRTTGRRRPATTSASASSIHTGA